MFNIINTKNILFDKIKIKSAKGFVNFNELIQNVYKPNGYDFDQFVNDVIPKLRLNKEQTCYKIYDNILFETKTNTTPSNSKRILLIRVLQDNFTLDSYSTLNRCCFNDSFNNEQLNINKVNENSKKWTQKFIDGWINDIRNGGKYLQTFINHYNDSVSLYYATKYYNITGKKGAVIGYISPWIESILLANGASKIVKIDYQHIEIGHKNIIFLNAFDLIKAREVYFDTFDFIASFSSIEHSGLGRYGDPIDPMGDIREMQKLGCILKPGGLFFLGIPVGQDDVGYNCHRTYGRIRLPLIFAGFEILDVFYMKNKPIDLKIEAFENNDEASHFNVTQFVFVLEKED
ncbi:hypothetical protein ACQ4LE_000713 [Meloidogyne hapla]|uniref:DUF268 domain-containing protein n=1 Tax=Meloidogyne hapla TaxID=6305 RepID=A0A1I8BWR5_MELHA